MTLLERLRTIGQGWIKPRVEVREVTVKDKSIYGGTVDLFNSYKLSGEKTVSDKLLKANAGWVYKNNDVIAKEVGTIEFELFRVILKGGDIVFDPIISHPLLDALDRFNEFTSSSDGFYITSSHKNLAGDSFWYVEGTGTRIEGIYPLQPDKVELEFGDRKAGQRIIEAYKYETTVDGERVEETYEAEDIVHFKNPNPENPYRGKSKVEAAAEAIDTDNFAVEANKSLFKRGLITNFILTTEKNLTDEQQSRLQAGLKGAFTGIANAFKIPIFYGGIKPESVQLSNKDMEFIEQQKWLRDKIMSIFGNTPASIGIVEDVNRANAESGILHWKRTTIKAEMQQITDTINEFLVPRFGDNLLLGFKDPVPEDRGSKIDEATKLKGSNIINKNEAREMLGYDPVEGGDEFESVNADPLIPELPKSISNITYKRFLRRNKIYTRQKQYIELRKATLKVAERVVKKRKKEVEEVREHATFTNEQVWNFHNKQIQIVEAQEQKFENKLKQFIDRVVKIALGNVPDEIPNSKNKQLFDEEELIVQATLDFRPILREVAIMSGQQALNLIGEDKPYLPDMDSIIERNIRKFTGSLLDTDRNKLIDMIAEGVAQGQSIPDIRRQITEEFDSYSKMQAERITRTEVIRASNQAAVDAWKQSDVVIAKQWLTAEDDRVDPECDELNGEILELNGIYEKQDYGSIKEPPLHPNCRCTVLPVVDIDTAFDAKTYLKLRSLESEKKELEDKLLKMDKRTKEYKQKKEELESYVNELEDYLDEA